MKIWRVSYALAAILLLTQAQAQRRGSRRYDVTQVSQLAAEEEEEEEPSLERSHRFKGRQRSSYLENNSKLPNLASRTLDDDLLQEFTTEFSRTGSNRKDKSIRNSNFKPTNTYSSRQSSLASQSESGIVFIDSERDVGRQSHIRSRERNDDRRNKFSPPTEVPSGETASTRNRNDRTTGRENKIRSRTQSPRRIVSNERDPLLSVTSMLPEELTTPSRSRLRQTIPSEETFTNRGDNRKGNRESIKSIPDDERNPVRTFTSRTADKISTRRQTRTKDTVLENSTQTQKYSRRQNSFPSNRNTPTNNLEIPTQDVETRIPTRRRVFENERTNPIPVQESGFVQRKSSLSTEYKGEKPIFRSGTSIKSLFTSKDSNDLPQQAVFTSGKITESVLQPSTNDVPIITEDHLELEDPKSETLLIQTVSPLNSKEETLNKALHARTRGRGSFDSQFSKTLPNLSQRKSQIDTESTFTSREARFFQRGNQQPRATKGSSKEEIRSFRSKLINNQVLPRISSMEVIDQDEVENSQQINRRRGSYETNMEPTGIDNQKSIGEKPQSSTSNGRRTVSKLSGDSETSTYVSRGRRRSRLDVGGQKEDEKNSGRDKDEEVSDDDNYPDVYKQLKKAGNGPKEILALLKARKKQREAQEAQREVQRRQKSLDPTTSRVNIFSDLNTEEDNVKPSIDSLPIRNKPSRKLQYEEKGQNRNNKPLRSSNRYQRVLNHKLNDENNQLQQVNEEKVLQNQLRSRYDHKKQAEDKNRIFENKKYSAKVIAPFDKEHDVETKIEKPFQKENNIHKTLNALGLDPNTLETTEPVTERERFIPSSRRTKPYGQSTEGIHGVDQSSTTFKPRYQLYEAKDRKTLLNKRFNGAKDISGEYIGANESEEDSIDRVKKYLRKTTTTRPSYTPQKPSSSRYSGRLKNKQSSVYRSSSLNQAVLEPQPNDQEPVTVHFFEVEGKAHKLESASLVTEASPTVSNVTSGRAITSEESQTTTVSAENTTVTNTNEASPSSSTKHSSSTETFLDNFVIDDKTVNIPFLSSTVPTTSMFELLTTAETITTTTQQPTMLKPLEPSLKPNLSALEQETSNEKKTQQKLTTTQPPIVITTQQQTITTTQEPIRSTNQKPKNTTKQQTASNTTQKPISKPTQQSKATTLKSAKTTVATQKSSIVTHTHTTTKPPKTSPRSSIKQPQPTKTPTTTIKSTFNTNKKPITTTKPTITTTKKINTTNPPPTVPKSPQTQSPLLQPIKMTATEASTTISDQLISKSNFVERSEFSTLPQIIMTTAQSLQSPSFGNALQSNEVPTIQNSGDYVAYALLPNNTLVRRVSPRSTIPPTEIPFVVYGLYPNGTIVKKFPNGTVVPDDPSPETNELVGEVDPLNKQGLSEILERDRSLAYLYPSTTISAKNMASTFSFSSEVQPSSTTSTTEHPTTVLTSTVTPATTTTTTIIPTTTTIRPTTTIIVTNKPTTTSTTTTKKPTITTTKKPTTTTTTTNKPTTTTTTNKPTTTTTKKITTTPTSTTEQAKTTSLKIITTTKSEVSTTQIHTTTLKPRVFITTPSNPTTVAPEQPSTTTITSSPSTTMLRLTTTTEKATTGINQSNTVKPTTSTITTTKRPTTTTQKPLSNLPEETTESSQSIIPTRGLSKDDFALLNSLLMLQSEDTERSNSIAPPESSPPPPAPSGPDDDDLANRIIQLAIERSQNSAGTEDLQQLSSSSEPSYERESKSIAPPLVDSMGVETSSQGGKISLWVVPESETITEETTKPQNKLTPEEEQVLTALLAAPQPTNSISLRDQLLLAELLAAGKNGASEEGLISTTKRPRKKKRPKTTTAPPPPALSPLSALFGGGGRGGGLFGSGAVPAGTDGEEGDYERPQGGLLVNAAINITRAVSQFMGLVLQGAAQSFQGFLASRTRNFADYFARGGAIS